MNVSSVPTHINRANDFLLHRDGDGLGMTLARNIVRWRLAKGWTQAEMAEASGMSRATVVAIESGTSNPRLNTLMDLACALNVQFGELVLYPE